MGSFMNHRNLPAFAAMLALGLTFFASSAWAACPIQPTGLIFQRWDLTGAQDGPMGCPASAVQNAPGGNGQLMNFKGGQIVTSPNLGPNFAVAAYQQGPDLVVDWGDTFPTIYAKFVVQWTVNGRASQRDVPNGFGTRGVWFLPLPQAGTYSITLGGCSSSGGACPAQLTNPVALTFVPVASMSATPCPNQSTLITGPIGDRWLALGGPDGPLGCPIAAALPIAGTTATAQNFQNGQMVFSPDQGPDMVVSLYQSGNQMFIDWATTIPFLYDRFIVRWTNGFQFDDNGDLLHTGNFPIDPFSPAPPVPVGTTVGIMVEGCNLIFGKANCDQKFTTPVFFTFRDSGPSPAALNGILDLSPPAFTPVSSADHVDDEFSQRGRAAAEYWACNKTLGSATGDEQNFMTGALGKLDMLSRGVRLCQSIDYRQEVNDALRRQTVGSNVGTTSTAPICSRTGEYDVALTGYVRIVEQYSSFLDSDVRGHIIFDLLNQQGPVDPAQFNPQTGFGSPCPTTPETENHLNMIESARYLTNQILYADSGDPTFDNEANGMNQFWLRRLQGFMKNDFWEFNSKVYQAYTDNAIQNLFDFSKDRRVKMGARLVLDYVSAKFAASQNFLRRFPPYRRHVSDLSFDLLTHIDQQTARFTTLSGNFEVFADPGFQHPFQPPAIAFADRMLMADVSTYRVPNAMLDLIVNQQHPAFYQRFSHYGLETYSSRPDYLISAGGFWTPSQGTLTLPGFGCVAGCDDEGPPVPITLMPSDEFMSVGDMIRFEPAGARTDAQTCVAPDFACGVNLRIPNLYVDANKRNQCWQSVAANGGTWTFINFSDAGCNPHNPGGQAPFGFLAAAWQGPGSGPPPQGQGNIDNFGVLEVHPRDPSLTFGQFASGVLQRNQATFTLSGTNAYRMTSGTTLRFTVPYTAPPPPNPAGPFAPFAWPFVTLGDPNLDRPGADATLWPLAVGDVVNSAGHTGLITFHNPGNGQGVVLNFSDMGEPNERILANQTVPSVTTQALSLAAPGDWTVSNGTGQFSPIAANGFGSLSVVGTGWVTTTSVPLSSADIRANAGPVLSSVAYDLYIPSPQPNAFWLGATQMYLSSPSAGIYNAYLGQVELTGQPVQQFVTQRFSVPSYAMGALTGNHSDVTITIVLNVNGGTVPWLLSNVRFGGQ
jgi:hypothetical protein